MCEVGFAWVEVHLQASCWMVFPYRLSKYRICDRGVYLWWIGTHTKMRVYTKVYYPMGYQSS